MSKYRVISGSYFAVFGLNTGKYRPEITPYLGTFHAKLAKQKENLTTVFNNVDLRKEISIQMQNEVNKQCKYI